jgi:hypothetical protein
MASGGQGVLFREVPGGLNCVRPGTGFAGCAELFGLGELGRARLDKIQQGWHLLHGCTSPADRPTHRPLPLRSRGAGGAAHHEL